MWKGNSLNSKNKTLKIKMKKHFHYQPRLELKENDLFELGLIKQTIKHERGTRNI